MEDTNTHNFMCESLDEFNLLSRDLGRGDFLSFYHLNVQRMSNLHKFDRLRQHLGEFDVIPDLLSVVETWFLQSETGEIANGNGISLYEIEGFQSIFCSRNERSAGVAIYVRNGLQFEVLDKNNGPVSYIHVLLKGNSNLEDTVCTVFYMPKLSDYLQLFDVLEGILGLRSYGRHVIMGDFNIDTLKESSVTLQYKRLLESFGFSISNNFITRPSRNGSIIDHVWSNVHVEMCSTLVNDLSDHYGVISHVKGKFNPEPTDVQYVDMKKTDFGELNSRLISTLYFSDFLADTDVNCKVEYLLESIKRCYDECTTVTRRKVCRKRMKMPWFSNELKTLCERKKRLLRRKRAFPNDETIVEDLRQIEVNLRAKERSAKRDYYVKRFKTTKTTKETWNEVNRLLGRKRSVPIVKRLISRDGQTTHTDTRDVSDRFNDYFTSIGNDLAQRIRANFIHTHTGDREMSAEVSQRSMFLNPVSPGEVYDLISKLDVSKSCGFDSVSNKMLKNCRYSITFFLSECINESFSQGIFPDCLKVAKVTPVFKSGTRDDAGNYRPISVLPSLNKIFEQALNSRLQSFLKFTNFLTDSQFGFRNGSNTTIAASELMNYMYSQLDKRSVNVVSGVFVDLSKAFDTVDHVILLKKLERAGIRGDVLSLFKSYLSNRMQSVCVNGVMSSLRPICTGVPQGSVIGPTLFLVFINDVKDLSLLGSLYLYADDAALFYAGSEDTINCHNMNLDLNVLRGYFLRNLLTLNESKTKFMHFHHHTYRPSDRVQVRIGENVIEKVNTMRYLGLELDTYLNFSKHIDIICARISPAVAALYKMRDFLPTDALKMIYFSLIHSHLVYLCCIWGQTFYSHMKPLQTLQNRALKLVYGLPFLTPTVSLYCHFVKNVLPIKGIHEYQMVRMVRQILNEEVFFHTQFSFRNSVQSLRDVLRVGAPNVRTALGSRQMAYSGPQYFNRLPYEIRSISRTPSFECAVKKHLSEQSSVERLFSS